MCSPVSPIVADLFMNKFENNIFSSILTPKIWLRYVYDTFVVLKRDLHYSFLEKINSVSPRIQFTSEAESDVGELPFLDCLVKRKENGHFSISIFRKKTHSNKCLDFKSLHPISAKISVVSSLLRRAHSLITDEKEKEEEISGITETLKQKTTPGTSSTKSTQTLSMADNAFRKHGHQQSSSHIEQRRQMISEEYSISSTLKFSSEHQTHFKAALSI
uniref:Helix-turn-helix domain-containing protein n=1 Tax=Trichobilharzia regenti TaxID=157069 RepID=A0AA85JCG1_TRIRE|nr:unnamed protein product [Trichobilharzia regenti]